MSRDEALMVAKAALKAQVNPQLRRVAVMYGDACLVADMDPCHRTERRERRFRRLLELTLEGAS